MSAPSETVSPSPHRVVLVDARDDRRAMMHRIVEGDETQAILVGEADSQAAALAVVDEQQADVVVIEVMPAAESLATIAALRQRYPQLGIVGCSFDVDRATAALVVAEGADLFLAKPLTRGDLLAALDGLAVRIGPEDQRADALQAGPG
jgi:DNA-binding NarL/FixJ family response regulator